MRIPRTMALGTGIAITAVTTLVITSSAVAKPEAGVVFVTSVADDLDSGWSSSAPSASGLAGLEFEPGDAAVVRTSLPKLQADELLVDFAAGVSFGSPSEASLTGVIELTVRDSGADRIVTLTAVNPGKASWLEDTQIWQTDGALGFFIGGEKGTLGAFAGASGPDTTITAAGFVSDGATFTMTSALVNGVKYLFTPRPVTGPPFSDSPLTPAEFAADGYTITTNGFLPDETLNVTLVSGTINGTRTTEIPEGSAALGTGSVTYNWTWAETEIALPGSYRITLASADGIRVQFFDFVVAEEAAVKVAAEDVLPATGGEPLALVVAAGALGLVGAGLLATVAIRRGAMPRA